MPHPTGYPTYVLLLRVFGDVVAIGSHAFRANLFSAFTGALTVPLIYVAASRLIRMVGWVVLMKLVVLALCGRQQWLLPLRSGRLSAFWTQNTITEVYSLNALFGAVLLVLTLGVI